MKKYLMMGAAALAMTLGFTSCSSDSENVYNEELAGVHGQFTNQFQKAFGKINPNNDWGFKTIKLNGTTRSHNVNRNEWGTGNGVGGHVAVPVNVTADEREKVYNFFNQERKVYKSAQVDWKNFFISEVWKGTAEYYDWSQYNWTYAKGTEPVRGELKDGAQTFLASDQMDHLQVRYGDGSIDSNGNLVGDWEHANDFNNGNHYSSWGTIEGHTYMENSGTKEFSYLNSKDSKYHNEYIIVPGEEIDPSLKGYYYVAFDFYANAFYVQDDSGAPQHLNMCADRDWFYTDWIVRISPAEYKPGPNTVRIIAEDLAAANGSDFDYNDVVFDVEVYNTWLGAPINDNKLVADVWLLAAGGTMPLYLGEENDEYEVHNLFEVATGTMVNTKNGTVTKDPVYVQIILGPAQWNGTYNYADFPVIVDGRNGKYELQAKVGKAPEKILVQTDYQWCDERETIAIQGDVKEEADGTYYKVNTGRYPDFLLYVSNTGHDDTWWKTFASEGQEWVK